MLCSCDPPPRSCVRGIHAGQRPASGRDGQPSAARREDLAGLDDLTLDEIDEAIRFELIADDDHSA